MKKQFLIFKLSEDIECMVLDKKRNKIVRIKDGKFTDLTDECKKMYDKELKKERNKNGKKIGGLWYECLNGLCDKLSACIWKDEVIIETDNQIDFDTKLFDLQQKQLELLIRMNNNNTQKLQNNEQYYTYAFSNC